MVNEEVGKYLQSQGKPGVINAWVFMIYFTTLLSKNCHLEQSIIGEYHVQIKIIRASLALLFFFNGCTSRPK